MKKIISGRRYKFVIDLLGGKNNFHFRIKAIDLQNKTYSFINNISCILSEFNISIDNFEKMESTWVVKKREGKDFFNKSANFISDNKFREYLEKQLNFDQELGEWNK